MGFFSASCRLLWLFICYSCRICVVEDRGSFSTFFCQSINNFSSVGVCMCNMQDAISFEIFVWNLLLLHHKSEVPICHAIQAEICVKQLSQNVEHLLRDTGEFIPWQHVMKQVLAA